MPPTKYASFAVRRLPSGVVLAMVSAAQARNPRIGFWVERPGSTGIETSYEDLGDDRIRLRLTGLVVEARCDGATYPFVGANGQPAGPMYSCRVPRRGRRAVRALSTCGVVTRP